MSNSKAQLMAQIAQTNNALHYHQAQLKAYKACLNQDTFANSGFKALALTVPALLMGWSLGRKKSVRVMTTQLVEIGLLAASSQFKRQLMNFWSF